eukprot:5462876-Amphidinium_carterae.1
MLLTLACPCCSFFPATHTHLQVTNRLAKNALRKGDWACLFVVLEVEPMRQFAMLASERTLDRPTSCKPAANHSTKKHRYEASKALQVPEIMNCQHFELDMKTSPGALRSKSLCCCTFRDLLEGLISEASMCLAGAAQAPPDITGGP